MLPISYVKCKSCAFIYEVKRLYANVSRLFSKVTRLFAKITRYISKVSRLFAKLTRFIAKLTRVFAKYNSVLIPKDSRRFVKVSCNLAKVTRLFANFFLATKMSSLAFVQWNWFVVFWKRGVVKNYQSKDKYHNKSYTTDSDVKLLYSNKFLISINILVHLHCSNTM